MFSYLSNSLRKIQCHSLFSNIVIARQYKHVFNANLARERDVGEYGDEDSEPRRKHYERHDHTADVRRHFDEVDLVTGNIEY